MNNLPIDKVDKIDFIKNKCKGRSVLDLGCVRHDAAFSMNDPNWLHRHLCDIAESIVGVDYVENEVRKLNQIGGYSIIYGDVTKPLPIEKRFDVIVAGDLIEHLTCFEGFFDNVNRLLKDDGILILTTPNPFYRDGFFYTLLKNDILVNPEHTCWIDPKCMNQLIERFSLEIIELHWLNGSNWALRMLITQNAKDRYDILKGKWEKNTNRDKIRRKMMEYLFEPFYLPFKILISTNSTNYADYLAVIQKKKGRYEK